MTLGLMGVLAERKVACPDQMSVLGFDDFDWTATFNPRLNTMAERMCEMGKSAMEMLLQRIETPTAEPESEQARVVVLEAELRVRDSTVPPPRDLAIPMSFSIISAWVRITFSAHGC
jgi:LacI family transcriptional regulator